MKEYRGASAWKGFVAGAIGGAVATAALDVFQRLSLEGTRKGEDLAGGPHIYTGQQEEQLALYEYAHAEVAERVAKTASLRLSASQQKALAPVVHYGFGALCGGVYGLLAEIWPGVTAGFGTAFGGSLFVSASEAVLPAMGLMPAPSDTPPLLHAGGWAAHAVYGAGTEAVRRVVRSAL
ncbi:MAG: hypothetical protein NVSMB3_13830 [Acidobacteriaceae bacterium]